MYCHMKSFKFTISLCFLASHFKLCFISLYICVCACMCVWRRGWVGGGVFVCLFWAKAFNYFILLSADAPPLLCLGSIPAVADMCVHFFNMTYRVDRLGLHKSQILGCTDMSLNIYNKTISVFPVDCFQIPGDPNHHPKEENIILPNFVP